METKIASPRTAGKTRILIVEDDSSLAMLMVDLLMLAGCEVETVANAEQSVRLVQAADFDLITLDIDLPGGSGFEIFARLKKLPCWKNPPVIFISGRPFEEDQQLARELGAVDYILKPFAVADFISRILGLAERQPEFA